MYQNWQNQMKVTGVVSLNEFMDQGADITEDANNHSAGFVKPEDAVEKEELKKMLDHETNKQEDHYGARLSHWCGDTNSLTIDAGGLQALIRYYENHDTDLEGEIYEDN